jgi:2-methylcitrate dehydratase PrpD
MTQLSVVADFVRSLDWESLPTKVQDRARDRLLDALSTSVASREVEVVRTAVASVGSDPRGACTVLPTGWLTSPTDAAFVNGVAVHAILFEDIHQASADHPGAVIIPAALAAAEVCADLTGRVADVTDLLVAIVAGYEVQLHLGSVAALGVIARGFRTTSVFGCIAAAASAASVWRLNEAQTQTAIALGANSAFGIIEGWAHGTMEPFLQAGMAARAGLFAAAIARSGAQTAPPTFEGPNGFFRAFADVTNAATLEFKNRWRILDISCKPYPVSGAKIGAVDSALAARAQGFEAAEIASVIVTLPQLARDYPGGDRKGPFETMAQAQDSAQFCVAAALLGRPMSSLETFTERFRDPEVSTLTQVIDLEGEKDRQLSKVEITTRNGKRIVAEVDWRHLQRPTVEMMTTKLHALGKVRWSDETIDRISQLVSSDPRASVTSLSQLLRR